MLSTVFIHMVTEVRESLERATKKMEMETEFPFAELFICIGIMYWYLMMFRITFQDFC